MPVQSFSLAEFQSALPVHKVTGERLWVHLGIKDGEHCFLVKAGPHGAAVFIRSSVKADGRSAECGEDSIRVWIVKANSYLDYEQKEQWDISPLGPKTQRFITRIAGWEERLVKVIRILYKLALRTFPCPKCKDLCSIIKIKKGSNAGLYAIACRKACGTFKVLRDIEPPYPIRQKAEQKAEQKTDQKSNQKGTAA